MDLADVAKLLDLPEDADGVTVLAAVAALAPKGGSAPAAAAGTTGAGTPVAAGKKVAKNKGKKLKKGAKAKAKWANTLAMSPEETAALISAANAGQAASIQLAEQRFSNEFSKTLDEGRIAPAQEDTMRALFQRDPDLAIKTLSEMQRIVPMSPIGTGEDNPDAGRAPEGIDQGRYQLDHEARQRAKTLAKENQISEDEAYSLAAIEISERQEREAQPVYR